MLALQFPIGGLLVRVVAAALGALAAALGALAAAGGGRGRQGGSCLLGGVSSPRALFFLLRTILSSEACNVLYLLANVLPQRLSSSRDLEALERVGRL